MRTKDRASQLPNQTTRKEISPLPTDNVIRTSDYIDRLLTVKEAAQRLGTTERFPRRLIAQGRIDYVKLGEGRNGHVRIPESALDDYIEAGTVKAIG